MDVTVSLASKTSQSPTTCHTRAANAPRLNPPWMTMDVPSLAKMGPLLSIGRFILPRSRYAFETATKSPLWRRPRVSIVHCRYSHCRVRCCFLRLGRSYRPASHADTGSKWVEMLTLRFARSAASSKADIHLWLDALCINQEDLRERNHQVGLMRSIYINTDNVLLWLGEEIKRQ